MAAVYMKATYQDGREVVVRLGPKTMVAYERHFKMSLFDNANFEQTWWKVWHALREAGQEEREFDDWLGIMDGVSAHIDTPKHPIADEAVNQEPDPTQKVQPSGT